MNHYDVTVTLEITDLDTGAAQTIVSNTIHPFFAVPATARVISVSYEGLSYNGPIPGGAWVDAADLRPGDHLLQADGGWAEVTSVEIRDRPLLAWNMSVATTDSYFVTAGLEGDAVWVHNCDDDVRRLPNDRLSQRPTKRGNAPKGDDGHPVELHHTDQSMDGPLQEMTRTEHRGGDNFRRNHTNTGETASNIDRRAAAQQRRNHWRNDWDSGRFDGL